MTVSPQRTRRGSRTDGHPGSPPLGRCELLQGLVVDSFERQHRLLE
jgi:hypothetical protein